MNVEAAPEVALGDGMDLVPSSVPLPAFHVRREPFEYGLIPFPNLIFSDGLSTLQTLRAKLLENSLPYSGPIVGNSSGFTPGQSCRRVNVSGIAASLGLPETHAHLLLQTLAAVLPDANYRGEADPLSQTHTSADLDKVGADVDDLVLFLYIQSYKKPIPRPHKDAVALADVWPSTSAFDGFVSSLSLLQVKPSRKWVPSQADEEAHQLAYLSKHLPALLALLSESSDEASTESQVITLEKFNHLGFLLRASRKGSEVVPLSQATPFFANSDPDMPAVPVPSSQVLQWLAERLYAASEHPEEKLTPKENGPVSVKSSEVDVAMAEASANYTSLTGNQLSPINNGHQKLKGWHPEGLTFVNGITKASALKEEGDIHGGTVKVVNCHDAVVYVLAPLNYVSVYGCSDSIVALGPVGKVVRVEYCERVQLIVPAARIIIANCRDCLFYLGINQRPLFVGANHNLQVAPYNTFYPKMERHMAQAGVDSKLNMWDKILTLGMVDPHDSLSHPAGVADAQAEGASLLPPERFMNFMIPRWNDNESSQGQVSTKSNPFVLPTGYLSALQKRNTSVELLRQTLKNAPIDDKRKHDLSNAIHVHFREWLYSSGNIRQLYDFQVGDGDSKAMD